MTPLDDNLSAVSNLKPEVQDAARAWVKDCFSRGFTFRIIAVYRTPQEQHALWQKGRNANGGIMHPAEIVTYDDGYTRKSMHQLRLAVDIYPLNCTYQQAADVAAKYGITHPFGPEHAKQNQGFVDQPHFQFDQVPPPPAPVADPQAKLRSLDRAISRAADPEPKETLEAQRARLQARISTSSPSPV